MESEKTSVLYADARSLISLREQLEKRDALAEQAKNIDIERQRIEKDIITEQKEMSEDIDATLKSRRKDVTATFDREIDKDEAALKSIRNNRERAKAKGIAERISNETEELKINNRNIKEDIKTTFKQKSIPTIFNNRLFFALFCTKGAKEIAMALIFWVICIVVIPLSVMFIAAPKSMVVKVIIFVAVAVIPCVIISLIRVKVKKPNEETIIQMRPKWDMIILNSEKMKEIKVSIKNDKDETGYDLAHYDSDITETESRISQVAEKKNSALEKFENETKPVIVDEITKRCQAKIDEMKQQTISMTNDFNQVTANVKDLTANIMSSYGAYMGNEFMSVDKVDKLLEIFEGGEVKTVGEALQVYAMRKNK